MSEAEVLKALETMAADVARYITRSSVTEQVDLAAFRRDVSSASEDES